MSLQELVMLRVMMMMMGELMVASFWSFQLMFIAYDTYYVGLEVKNMRVCDWCSMTCNGIVG
jgi:hypothetical protein